MEGRGADGRRESNVGVTDGTTEIQGWIDRLVAGDSSARVGLLRCVNDRLGLMARKMLRGYARVARWEDADDVLQNAYIRLGRALDASVPPTALDFFKLAAALIRHELIDLARHYGGPRGLGAHYLTPAVTKNMGETGGNAAEAAVSPDELALWTEFHTAIKGLPDEHREMFDLLWYQGLTQAEAASVLGVVEKTVQRRWIKARKHLSDSLSGPFPA
jgi:RNA polymerase sigma factor (sigma-70 family)